MLVLVVAHFVAGTLAPALVRVLGRRAFPLLAMVPLTAFCWAVAHSASVHAGNVPTETVTWVPVLGLDLALSMGTLQWVMALLVTGVGCLVLFYCARYFDDDEPGLGGFAGRAGRLRRRNAGPDPRRQPAPAVRVLGADHRLLLPAHRLRPCPPGESQRSDPGAAGHHCGRTGHAGGHRRARHPCRHLPHQRAACRSPDRGAGDGRRAPAARGGCVEVRSAAFPLLAAFRDGRPYPGQRLPACGGDGQSRRLPGGPPCASVLAGPRLARRPADRRPGDDAARGVAGVASGRPEAPSGLRDGEPAGSAHRPGRRGDTLGRHGRHRHACRACAVQGVTVPDGRRDRQAGRYPGPARALRCRSVDAGAGRGGSACGGVDGRPAADGRLRGQGERVRRAARRQRRR